MDAATPTRMRHDLGVCRFWESGEVCPFGNDCRFRHAFNTASEQRSSESEQQIAAESLRIMDREWGRRPRSPSTTRSFRPVVITVHAENGEEDQRPTPKTTGKLDPQAR